MGAMGATFTFVDLLDGWMGMMGATLSIHSIVASWA